jgi:hypothetical protein
MIPARAAARDALVNRSTMPLLYAGLAIVFRYWKNWHERRRLARLDADRLMDEYGAAAYEVAWTLAQDVDSGTLIESRPAGHWDRVRNIIARRTYRPFWRA